MTTRDEQLTAWRDVALYSSRVARWTAGGALAAVVVVATIPLWSTTDELRIGASSYYNGTASVFGWRLEVTDAWWQMAVVLTLPVLSVILGAWLTARALSEVEAIFATSSGGSVLSTGLSGAQDSRLTPAQRRARQRAQSAKDLSSRSREASLKPARESLWTLVGWVSALIVGGWFLIALILDAAGATAYPAGAWFAVYSWWLVFPIVVVAIIIDTAVHRTRAK